MKKLLPTACLLLLACDALPRDPEGTSERIAQSRVIRVGLATGGGDFGRAASARLLDRLARETGARPQLRAGATEPLFTDLQQARLDVVLAPLSPKSPWATMVALSPPLATRGEGEEKLDQYAVLRNGENRWIMTVEKAARAAADPGADQ